MNGNIHDKLISTIIGKAVRIYKTGDILTQEFIPDRVNIELSNTDKIVRIWMG